MNKYILIIILGIMPIRSLSNIQIMFALTAIVLFALSILTLLSDSSQWGEIVKNFSGFVFCTAIVWGVEIVKVGDGSTYDKAKIEQIQIHEKSNNENHKEIAKFLEVI